VLYAARGRKKDFFPPWNPLHHLLLFIGEVMGLVRLRSLTSGDCTIRRGGS